MARSGMVCAVAVAVVAGAGPLVAQAPPERDRIAALRDRFAAVNDTATLAALERERIAVARAERDDPLIHFELGFLSFRLGTLTGVRRRFEDAASEFQWAADLRPDWALAWYWLGLSELAVGESSVIPLENLRQVLGHDALSRAATAFARALEADPGLAEALVDLGEAALRQRIAPRLEVARAALRRSAGTPAGRDPRVLLVRGRVERRTGEPDSALRAFRAYLAAGGAPDVGGLEVARAQVALGRLDSALAAYLEAASRVRSDTGRAAFRADLRWVATPVELAAYDAAPAESLGVWLRRFWTSRAVADARRPAERLAEHFRRLEYAREHFRLVSRRRGFDVAFAYRDTAQSELDDRGVVYVRHGDPDQRVMSGGGEPNESWLYRRPPPAGDLVLHFEARGDVQDFRLVQSLAHVCSGGALTQNVRQREVRSRGFGRPPIVVSTTSSTTAQSNECYAARAEFGGVYARLAGPTSSGFLALLAEEQQLSTRSVEEATGTDSHPMRFAGDLRPVVSSFVIADAAGQPELHTIFALPGSRMHPLESATAPTYAVALRLVVFDSTYRLLAGLDTVRVFRAAQRLSEGSFLTEQVVLRVPPGRHRYTLVVEELNAASGARVGPRTLEVPDFGEGFQVSDVVLGREGSGLVWRRPDGEIPLNPLERFPRDGAATLYYEVHGLPQGAGIATEVRVRPQGGRSLLRRVFGGRGGAELAYTTVTDAPGRSRVRQTLDLGGLRPGRYQLEVALTDVATGRRQVRRQLFEIGPRAP